MGSSDQPGRSNAPPSELRAQYTALLIIHGIGEQNPYETIDQFGRSLTRYLRHEGGMDDLELIPDRVDHNDWIEAKLRLRTSKHGPGQGEGVVDLFEYYWAPETENKVNYRQSLWWLIKATVSPIRRFDENITLQEDDSGKPLTGARIFRRELLRLILIYVPFLVLFFGLLLLIPRLTKLSGLIRAFVSLAHPAHPVIAGCVILLFAISAVLAGIVVRQLFRIWLRHMREWPAMMSSWWLLCTASIATLSAWAGIALAHFAGFPLKDYFRPVLTWNTGLALGVFVLAKLIQIFLRDFVGDLAVYLNISQKAENHAARISILRGATQALARLLKGPAESESGPQYDQVIIIAHSLGSVIAYDCLNTLINRRYAAPDPIDGRAAGETISSEDLVKIKGLVTFGSPLDKVYYFFREEIREEQSIRAQIASYLDSFRRIPSGRDYGENKFVPYVPNQLSQDFRWFNAWSNFDPISGALHFYSGIERRNFRYLIPIYAHLSYWDDPRFYSFFVEPLLLGQAMKEEIVKAKRAAV